MTAYQKTENIFKKSVDKINSSLTRKLGDFVIRFAYVLLPFKPQKCVSVFACTKP